VIAPTPARDFNDQDAWKIWFSADQNYGAGPGCTAVPGGGALLMVATTGVFPDSPAVTSLRPLSVRPLLMASRVMRLSVIV
jgi:hypothetical protein